MYVSVWISWIILPIICLCNTYKSNDNGGIKYKRNPAPDGHRCGVCPTYFQKICAFNFETNGTFIFDNHCVMDLYNCIEGTDGNGIVQPPTLTVYAAEAPVEDDEMSMRSEFIPMNYEQCLYFGNFAYVHGFKYDDEDYGEDHIIVKGSKKNPDFVR